MPVFTYKATDLDLTQVEGDTVADTPRQARDQLRDRGLNVYEMVLQGVTSSSNLAGFQNLRMLTPFRGRKLVGGARLVEIIRELATLLGVGMTVTDALDTIVRQHRGWMRMELMQLKDKVAAGSSLADAMRQLPGVFDAVTIHMTEVGESAGTLDQVLNELATYKERVAQLRGKISSALIYPAIVFTTGIGVAIFLMSYVVPNLLQSLIESGHKLPTVTRIVKGASDLLIHRWWLLLGIVGFVVFLGLAIHTTHRGKRAIHGMLLRLPLLGELIRKQAVVRIAFVTSTLMRSGIPFERAIAIAQQSTSNLILREALDACEKAVLAGRDIGAALEHTRAFSPTVVQVFALGQQSGRLEEMLDCLAVDYDRQVTTAAARFTAVLEPILILLLATIVGTVAFATILPILEVGNVL
ncbi:MAG: type II secretion system F family protein [Phycisphaeraceae bacterium]|nr:type II secretion system F family protein [Phycisphaeraceae bacterium]